MPGRDGVSTSCRQCFRLAGRRSSRCRTGPERGGFWSEGAPPACLILLASALALLTALLLAGPALSKVLVGTDEPETLIGTKRNDQITGKGGQDILKGKAGNDTYFFADDWGQDFLIEGRRRARTPSTSVP